MPAGPPPAAAAGDAAARWGSWGDMVTVASPNSVDWCVAAAAAWKLGAVPQPVSARLPVRELQAIVDLADPAVVVGGPRQAAGDRQARKLEQRTQSEFVVLEHVSSLASIVDVNPYATRSGGNPSKNTWLRA